MKKVIITSLNPAKIHAVEAAFEQAFATDTFIFEGINVPSGVPEQPMTSEQTLQGAQNRIKSAKQQVDADFYVGIEAGFDDPFTFAWMVIESQHRVGKSRSASLALPPSVIAALKQGRELGDVMDEVFFEHNIKQKGGAIGVLTHHLLTRSSVYQQALILALIPFMHQELFSASGLKSPV